MRARGTRARLAAALLAVAPALAAAPCSMGWVCVVAEESRDAVELVAENLKPWPLTVSVRVSAANLEAAAGDERTLTLGGGERRTVMRMERVRPGERWRYRYWFDWTVGDMRAHHDDDYLYGLPYAPGTSYRVLQGYGSRFSHTGLEEYTVDFDMAEGTPVHAARDGVVVRTEDRNDKGCWDPDCGRYANFIVVLHDDGTTGEYYHLRKGGVLVEEGQRVRRGQHIAYSGNTGKSTLPHLHFGVYRADPWGKTQSLPVRFATAGGVLARPRPGRRYQAP